MPGCPPRSGSSRRRRLIAAAAVAAALVSVTFFWLVGCQDGRAQAILHDTLSATMSFHWTLDQNFQGDCFVWAAQACADDANDVAFCGRCINPMVWAHVSLPRLVAVEHLGGIPVWHLSGQPTDEVYASAGVADVWIGFDHHPLEAYVAPDFSEHDTFRYSCFNRIHSGPGLRPADHQPRPMSPATVTC